MQEAQDVPGRQKVHGAEHHRQKRRHRRPTAQVAARNQRDREAAGIPRFPDLRPTARHHGDQLRRVGDAQLRLPDHQQPQVDAGYPGDGLLLVRPPEHDTVAVPRAEQGEGRCVGLKKKKIPEFFRQFLTFLRVASDVVTLVDVVTFCF